MSSISRGSLASPPLFLIYEFKKQVLSLNIKYVLKNDCKIKKYAKYAKHTKITLNIHTELCTMQFRYFFRSILKLGL